MFMLVSLAQVKEALKIETTASDATLETFISAASLAVIAYLGDQAGEVLSVDSPPDSPPNDLSTVDARISTSVILLVGILYKEPDGDTAKAFSHGQLPWMVTALLYPMRDPVMA